MADNGTKSANEAEREVERARAQLVQTLDSLHDRLFGTVEEWKGRLTPDSIRGEITTYAQDTRAQLMRSAQERVQTKVMANPLPALMIGGGAAWSAYRIARSIPAPLVMVGAGVAWLMRSGSSGGATVSADPYASSNPAGYVPGGVAGYGYPVEANPPSPGIAARVTEAATNLGDAALDASARARDAVRGAKAQVTEAVSGAVSSATASVSDAVSSATSSVTQAAGRVGEAVGLSDSETSRRSASGTRSDYAGPAGMNDYAGRTSRATEPQYRPRRPVRRSVTDISAMEGWAIGGVALAVGTAAAFALGSGGSSSRRGSTIVRVRPEPGTPHRPVPPLEVRERQARERAAERLRQEGRD